MGVVAQLANGHSALSLLAEWRKASHRAVEHRAQRGVGYVVLPRLDPRAAYSIAMVARSLSSVSRNAAMATGGNSQATSRRSGSRKRHSAITERIRARSAWYSTRVSLPFPQEAKAVEPTAQLIEFPQWPEGRCATAQAVFRSALFPAVSFKGGTVGEAGQPATLRLGPQPDRQGPARLLLDPRRAGTAQLREASRPDRAQQQTTPRR